MSRSARTTKTQKEFILNYLEANRVLLGGKCNPTHLPQIQKQWETLAEELNKIGPKKTVRQWKDAIGDMKTTVKRRAREVKYGFTGTGGGTPAKPLKEFEERFLALISTLVIDGADIIEAGPSQSTAQKNLPDEISISEETSNIEIDWDTIPITLAEPEGPAQDQEVQEPITVPPTQKSKPTQKKRKPALNKNRVHAALTVHDRNLARLANSNVAIARAINNLARAINSSSKKFH